MLSATFDNRIANAADSRVQDEVITARSIKAEHPELTWTECLLAAKQFWDKTPVF